MRNSLIGITAAVAGAFICAAVLPVAAKVSFPESDPLEGLRSDVSLVWRESLSDAIAVAGEEYKPVLVFFTSPDCGYCLKLKAETLTDGEVRKVLEHFELVEVDVTRDRTTAERYQVRGVPAILILSSNGRVKTGVSGFVTPEKLLKILKNVLNPEVARKVEDDFVRIMDRLELLGTDEFPESAWPAIVSGLGAPDLREPVRDKVLGMSPFPGSKLVSLLQHEQLDVRLGALELLEEASGESFGFDPWIAAEGGGNDDALEKWRAWAGSTNDVAKTHYSALTADQVRDYLADLLSGDTQKSLRAARMLEQGGTAVLDVIDDFLKENPGLSSGKIGKLRVVKYAVLIPSDVAGDAADIAHRLVFGTLNVRLDSIRRLQRTGIRAVPALREFLEDDNPMIRETAIEALASAGGMRVVGILKNHLDREKDVDVIHTTLRVLGDTRSTKALKTLTGYLSHSKEDLVIVALKSIAKLRKKTVARVLKPCLDDERWRVRAVALETIGKLGVSSLESEVEKALDDEDEFVRNQAVQALAELKSKGAADKLKKLFAEEDNLKAPIIRAFGRMNLALPERFITQLKEEGPDILLPVMDALEDCGAEGLKLAAEFVDDKSLDVSCAAIRFIARRGMKNSRYQALIAKALRDDRKERVMSALESMKLSRSSVPNYQLMLWQQEQAEGDEPEAKKSSKEIEGVFDAFLGTQDSEGAGLEDEEVEAAEDKAAGDGGAVEKDPAEGSSAEVTVGEVINAFVGSEEDGEGEKEGGSLSSSTPFGKLLNSVEELADSEDENIRFRASLQLLRLGNLKGLTNLTADLQAKTAAERLELAESMKECSSPKIFPALSELLRDSSKKVRAQAAEACFVNASREGFAETLFIAVLDPESRLSPDELYSYRLNSVLRTSSSRSRIRPWLKKVLDGVEEIEWQNFALIVLEKCWRRGDEKLVLKHIDSEDPFQRRAAFHTLGMKARKTFGSRLEKVGKDPAEKVRLVLPKVYNQGSIRWLHYFDKDNFVSDHYSSYSYGLQRSKGGLSEEAEEWVRKLTDDISPKVGTEAYFCLLTNRKKVNLVDFLNTVKSFPDYEAVAARVGQYLARNYKELGDSFKILLPFLEQSRRSAETLARVRSHFGVSDQAMAKLEKALLRPSGFQSVEAEFVASSADGQVQRPGDIKLVYFTSPGCAECERAEEVYLPQLKKVFPSMEVEKHNIRKISAMRLNEALCERFDVPAGVRLVTPAVFGGGGYLIKDDVRFERLAELASQSASVPLDDWYVLGEEEMAQADEAIAERFSKLGIGVVAVAGMLDGINPCAFATIIFFLSYLQVSRRRAGEIAQIGIAFIAAVFISYFFLGLGLVEVIAKSQALGGVAEAVNWIIAALALVVMALSVRDGILCLKGRLSDITLQLPSGLKERIHRVARAGARHRHFVLAAFVAGVVISLLELACTGQVYAPTILYMLKIGRNTGGALFYLILYNIAFVVPLGIIFVMAYSGVRSQALGRFLEKHAATVKFATAALFLFLALFLIFGDRIANLSELI